MTQARALQIFENKIHKAYRTMKRYSNYSLKGHNTFGMDVRAAEFIQYDTVAELQEVLPELQRHSVFHIGGGSNLLFTHDFDGTILHSAVSGIELADEDSAEVLVRVGAGVIWDDLVGECCVRGWHGMENLSLIPGEVGASAVQNIGAYGKEAKDFIHKVEAVDLRSGEMRVFDVSECDYSYRHSAFKDRLKGLYAITHVTFRLSKKFAPDLGYGALSSMFDTPSEVTPQALRDAVIRIRESKLPDPKLIGNAGSFFMNPVVSVEKYESLREQYPDMPHYEAKGGVKIPAGWMIEQCGWKGKALGRAAVYEKQALVLVNAGGAAPKEILALSEKVCQSVYGRFGIEISPEVIII